MQSITKEEVFEIVSDVIKSYSIEINSEIKNINHDTRLIGISSQFDSSDLVQIIVEVEDRINSVCNSEITLTDEKAMSRTTSPFINVETFVRFIKEKLDEK
jgi:hypothetical protein